MGHTVRPLVASDVDAVRALGREAFGAPPSGWTPPPDYPGPGRHEHGAFHGDVLAAKIVSREFHSWWHGRAVPTNGIAGVAVSAEHRGSGLLDELFATALAEGLTERGEAVSTLFATAPGVYRRLGYELVGSLETVEVPMTALARIPAQAGIRLRRAGSADVDALRSVHEQWAARTNGPLTRRGPSFPESDEDVVGEFTGVTIAEDDTGVVGYCSWDRGTGYDEAATIEVSDLLALSAPAYAALWRMLGSFSTVTGSVRLWTSGTDVARLTLPSAHWRVVERHPYMLRIHDVPAALTGLTLCPPGWQVPDVRFAVAGDLLGTADGAWSLSVEAGVSACVPADTAEGAPVFAPRGLAMVWSGAYSCADARAVGLLSGGAPDTDRTLDLLFGGGPVHVRDYF